MSKRNHQTEFLTRFSDFLPPNMLLTLYKSNELLYLFWNSATCYLTIFSEKDYMIKMRVQLIAARLILRCFNTMSSSVVRSIPWPFRVYLQGFTPRFLKFSTPHNFRNILDLL